MPEFSSLSYQAMKAELKERGLSTKGKKAVLLQRLEESAAAAEAPVATEEEAAPAAEAAEVAEVAEVAEAAEPAAAVEEADKTEKRARDESAAEAVADENDAKRQAVEPAAEAVPEAAAAAAVTQAAPGWTLPEGTPYILKCLIPDQQAGLIIGKGGATIKEIKSVSGAKVQLSRNNIFYPGTQDRVLMFASETMAPVLIALSMVMAKQYEALEKDQAKLEASVVAAAPAHIAKLLVPQSCAGLVIGKGGCNIKRISSESGCKVQLGQKTLMPMGMVERVVTVQGAIEQQLECSKMIFELMHLDEASSAKSTYQNTTVDYAPANQGHMMRSPHSFNQQRQRFAQPTHGGMMQQRQMYGQPQYGQPQRQMYGQPQYGQPQRQMYGMQQQQQQYGRPQQAQQPQMGARQSSGGGGANEVVVQVPDGMVGAIIGSGGSKIQEIQSLSGARVHVSNKGEYVPGTQNRIVTMSGNPEQCKAAQLMIQKAMDTANQSRPM